MALRVGRRYRVALHISRRHDLCGIAIVAISLIAGCGSPTGPSGNEWRLGIGDNGRLLSVRSGDTISVTLHTIGPNEYDEHPSVSSPAVAFVKFSVVPPFNPGGPTQLFEFRAVAAGHAIVSIPHALQDPVFQTPPFEVSIDVR